MKNEIIASIMMVLFAGSSPARQEDLNQPIFDLMRGEETAMSEVVSDLKKNRIILVGEHHSNKSHHQAQLRIIQALTQTGASVAIGLEMFRSDSQDALDSWIEGKMDEIKFQQIYYDNWNFPYAAYRLIFEYAREKKIPMIGLNVSRDITRQVSRQGFQSLSEAEKGKLSDVTCRVDEAYMKYIKKAFGAHAHGNLNFIYFCEAQLVWDNVMAIHALNYLMANPDSTLVILTGTGHAQKAAIPRQIEQRSNLPFAVILPEIPGKLDADTINSKDADYLMLDLN